jgi:hypothetical protein
LRQDARIKGYGLRAGQRFGVGSVLSVITL